MTTTVARPETPSKPQARDSDPINWKIDATKAYQDGIDQNLPIVMIFLAPVQRNSRFSNQMRSVVFSDAFQALANRAVFVFAEPDNDAMVEKIFKGLEVKVYPTISVLEPNADRVVESVRIEGFFKADELVAHLEKWIGNNRPKQP